MFSHSGEYTLALLYSFVLCRILEYMPNEGFGTLMRSQGQVDWFILTCMAFAVYFVYLRNRYNYWAQFSGNRAKNKREDCSGLEQVNMLYLSFNAGCMYFHPMPFLQVLVYFAMPIAIGLVSNSKN